MKNKNYIFEILLVVLFLVVDISIVLAYDNKKRETENRNEWLALQKSLASNQNKDDEINDTSSADQTDAEIDDEVDDSSSVEQTDSTIDNSLQINQSEPEYEDVQDDVENYDSSDLYSNTEKFNQMSADDYIFAPGIYISEEDLDNLAYTDIYDPGGYLYDSALMKDNKKVDSADYDHYIKVRAALNELYAMNGFIFSKPYWGNYFSQYNWYCPENSDYINFEEDKNSWEYDRYITILEYEKAHNWR